ncbi:hypothetical protein [Singulisphaera acidiphila]|uniref:Uncharacterized protein n=1 Tax=Singulisphaera acidiphila (strain ATCC BAA-1392 / DSM 18658 / VKM B-2454 / MOB10) TaxID=886293 RepID=L0DMT9_SINAD|nr:hypothetical protein [Singulisphaera acidiphila]AGA30140.1 hypothetical protein Sinac_6030 [Singulisphaera acidiphila DSM 18658]
MRRQDLVGLDVLVGLTYFNAEGEVLRQEQFHGLIEESEGGMAWVRPSDGGERRWVPAKVSAFRPAPGGTYRLASTGQVVVEPTLLTSWMLTLLNKDEDGKLHYKVEPNFAPLSHSRVPLEWKVNYTMDDGRIRRTIEAFGDEYVGRTLLLGINYTGPDGGLRRQEQIVGTIMVVDLVEGIVVSCDPDGRTVVLPSDPTWVEKAPPAQYRLRSTGQVVTNPDYLADITIRQPD